jgi:hypothetical protein
MESESHKTQLENDPTYQLLLERIRLIGLLPDAPAFQITWGQLVERLALFLSQHGHPVQEISDDRLADCLRKAADSLVDQERLPWLWMVEMTIENALFPAPDPESDDEGPLTEEYENWSRIEDGWLDSAFEDRFELGYY